MFGHFTILCMKGLSKIGFSMECFTTDFCDFLPKKNWLLGGPLGTRHQIQAFQGFS